MLETERLLLQEWRPEDWLSFRPIAIDPEVMRYITGGSPWTDEQIRGFVDQQIQMLAEHGYCRWRLIEKSNRDFIGFCGVGFWRGADPEIGWWLAPRAWGRGLASEAARAALRHVFQHSNLDRVISVARVGNAASIRVMEKLGLKFDRAWEDGGVPLLRYVITREEYFTSFRAPR